MLEIVATSIDQSYFQTTSTPSLPPSIRPAEWRWGRWWRGWPRWWGSWWGWCWGEWGWGGWAGGVPQDHHDRVRLPGAGAWGPAGIWCHAALREPGQAAMGPSPAQHRWGVAYSAFEGIGYLEEWLRLQPLLWVVSNLDDMVFFMCDKTWN